MTLVGGTKVVVLLLLLLLSSSSSSTCSSSSSFFSVSSVVTVAPSAEARYKGEEGVVASKERDDVVGEVAACAQCTMKSGVLLFGNFFEIRYFVQEIHREKISYKMEAL